MSKQEERTDRLEEEVAHLTMANEELSSEVLAQWKRIEELEKQLSKLNNRFLTLEEGMENPIENTKPPHW